MDEILREEIRQVKRKRGEEYRLTTATGISRSSIKLFLSGNGLTLASVQKLCDYFGYKLVKKQT